MSWQGAQSHVGSGSAQTSDKYPEEIPQGDCQVSRRGCDKSFVKASPRSGVEAVMRMLQGGAGRAVLDFVEVPKMKAL